MCVFFCKQKTADEMRISDWSSDVCSSDLVKQTPAGKGWKTLTFSRTLPLPTYLVAFAVGPWDVVDGPGITATPQRAGTLPLRGVAPHGKGPRMKIARSEGRRVGKECVRTCGSRGSPYHKKKKTTKK